MLKVGVGGWVHIWRLDLTSKLYQASQFILELSWTVSCNINHLHSEENFLIFSKNLWSLPFIFECVSDMAQSSLNLPLCSLMQQNSSPFPQLSFTVWKLYEIKKPVYRLIVTMCLVYTAAEYWERKILWTVYILSVHSLALLFWGFYGALFQMSCDENRLVCLGSPHLPGSAFFLPRKCTKPASEFAVSSDQETTSHLSSQNQRKYTFYSRSLDL